MQIILVSSRFATAKTITIGVRHIVAVFAAFLTAVFFGSAILSWFSIQWRLPLIQELVYSMQQHESRQAEQLVKDNLQAMAARVGELQAQMVQLDGLGKRLSERTGAGVVRKDGVNQAEPQGGPFVPASLSENALKEEIDRLAIQIQDKSFSLTEMEARLRETMVRSEFMPTTLPIAGVARLGSAFGPRLDPFGRGRAIHEGLDFVGAPGTAILAAASGVVVNAAYHPEFGNLVEISHGGELLTRYAHLSTMQVDVGTPVRRGQQIGTLGNTGRSTGPHLHFEVQENGLPRNPAAFLGAQFAKVQ